MILAGDIGGTKTLLGLFEPTDERPRMIEHRAFPTLDYASLADMARAFLAPFGIDRLDTASFGVAGPVVEQTAQLTNVPWSIDAMEVAAHLNVGRLALLNDLQAIAYAVPVLRSEELEVLQEGQRVAEGGAAVIAAGTGLGEALLPRVAGRLVPSPSEAGHADFAPRTPREIEFLMELTRVFGRAEWEQVLSGRGLVNLFRFRHRTECLAAVDPDDGVRAPALISAAALEGRCPDCVETLEMFVDAYGAEAGNLALRAVATAGLFIGGGIAPKVLPALKTGRFLAAFLSKPPMDEFLAKIPVSVILDDRAGLLGAAVHASRL
ncbi:MAG: glucokinase [Acidobacteria bacterium]|nr:glucokinase [Acidobacteriota bacterium]